jgi:hypothetical protein
MPLVRQSGGGIDPMWTVPGEPLPRAVRMHGSHKRKGKVLSDGRHVYASPFAAVSLKARPLYPDAESSR